MGSWLSRPQAKIPASGRVLAGRMLEVARAPARIPPLLDSLPGCQPPGSVWPIRWVWTPMKAGTLGQQVKPRPAEQRRLCSSAVPAAVLPLRSSGVPRSVGVMGRWGRAGLRPEVLSLCLPEAPVGA
jgi:hypothetical protein